MWCEGGVVLTYHPLAFVGGWLFSYMERSFSYVGRRFHAWAAIFVQSGRRVVVFLRGRLVVILVVVIGRVLVVLLPCRRGRCGPCIRCEQEKGSGM